MRAELATPERLRHYITLRRRERWQMGGSVFVAGLGGIVLGIALLGALKLDPAVMPYVFVAPILVVVFGLMAGLQWWQRRALGVDAADYAALNKAFERALLRKQDVRFLTDDVGVAVLREELGLAAGATTTTTPPLPVFSDAQLAAWFRVQKSLRLAIMIPGLCLALMSAGNFFLVDPQAQGLVSGIGLLACALSAFIGHRRHRRIRGESGLSDHDLGTLRGAGIAAGLTGANGTAEDVAALRQGVVTWHQRQYGGA